MLGVGTPRGLLEAKRKPPLLSSSGSSCLETPAPLPPGRDFRASMDGSASVTQDHLSGSSPPCILLSVAGGMQ